MAIHDAYARTTPFELAFPEDTDLDAWVRGLLRTGGRGDGVDDPALAEPGRFLTDPRVAERLLELRDPSAESEAVHRHGLLFYHACRFSAADHPLYFLSTHAARHLVETEEWVTDDAAPPRPPVNAGYVQLPRNLFWYHPSDAGSATGRPPSAEAQPGVEAETDPGRAESVTPPEPVDGIFWAVVGGESGPDDPEGESPTGASLNVLAVSGMHEGRPGFSVIPLPSVPLVEARAWLDAEARDYGADFESRLPGGELERLYSLEAAGEILKLLARFFRYVELFPGSVSSAPPRDSADLSSGGPSPSSLTYVRVDLSDG